MEEKYKIIKCKAGKFKGKCSLEKIVSYKGIPYAKAPVGKLRWKKPEKLEFIDGIYDATEFGHTQVQAIATIPEASNYKQSENCLTLNIWQRLNELGEFDEVDYSYNEDKKKKRAVIIWIHGGGFYNGGTADPIFDGENFVKANDVIFVTINYRLGFFGFFDVEPFAYNKDLMSKDAVVDEKKASADDLKNDLRNGDSEKLEFNSEYRDSCNLGLYDCIAAIKWVKENIEAFGGDPERITLMGESAGATIVSSLTISPLANGLFKRAVCMSGTMSWGFIDKKKSTAEAISRKIVEKIGCKTINELLEMSSDKWRECIDIAIEMYGPFYGMIFTPTADGIIIPENPGEALRRGAAKDIELLIGYCKDEMRYLSLYDPDFYSHMEKCVEDAFLLTGDFPDNYKEIKKKLLDRTEKDFVDNRWDLLNGIMTHQMTDAICDIQSAYNNTYKYVWNWKSNIEGFGACHATDIAFVFNNLDTKFGRAFTGENPPEELAVIWGEAITAFAENGEPLIKGIEKWPCYDKENRMSVEISLNPILVSDERKSAREILSQLNYWS